VAALAEAIDAALDTWDHGSRPAWIVADPDRLALAQAIVDLLSQYGYTVTPIAVSGGRAGPRDRAPGQSASD
jgi:hypothetical protein